MPEYHNKNVEVIFSELGSGYTGMEQIQIGRNREKWGINEIKKTKSPGIFEVVWNQMRNPLVLMLLFSLGISLVLKEWVDFFIIAFVILTNTGIGVFQEKRAEQSIESLKKMIPLTSRCIRGGSVVEIVSSQLVVGDVVVIEAGDMISADIRLFEEEGLRIDESSLTGESAPVAKSTIILKKETLLSDMENTVFSGTMCVSGKAKGVVVSVGELTVLGQIARQSSAGANLDFPLVAKFDRFARGLMLLVLVSSLGIFIYEQQRGGSIYVILKNLVGITVATVPEGLPVVATVAMSLAVFRMGKKRAVIRKLPAAETLGETTVICSDKTGTLTENKMKVLECRGADKKRLLQTGYCAFSGVDTVYPDPTEKSIYEYCLDRLSNADKKGVACMKVMPFENQKRYGLSLIEIEGKGVIVLRGSPEAVLEMCDLGEKNRYKLIDEYEDMLEKGYRVIAIASRAAPKGFLLENEVRKGYKFLGFFGLVDPIRADTKESVARCQKAGIRVMMITGDHPKTALAIARKAGIETNRNTKYVSGMDIQNMSDEELLIKLAECNVYARITPEMKLRIVELLKKSGEVVAVTGDGINDAPALRAAHIGIAMGKNGTQVAREAADMVLLDDNFSSIVDAIAEARLLFTNLRKAVFFLVPTGFSVIIAVYMSMYFGLPMPFVAVQLLWINIVTNGLQDVAMAFEPAGNNLLQNKPHKGEIMTLEMWRRSIMVAIVIGLGVFSIYEQALAKDGYKTASTVAMMTMIIFQFFHLLNARADKKSVFATSLLGNKVMIVAMLMAFVALIASISWPPLMWMLHTTILPANYILQAGLMAAAVVLVVEIDKTIFRSK